MTSRRVAWLLSVLAGCTCGGPGEVDSGMPAFDAGVDAGARDAGQDAGVDSGTVDSGSSDSGTLDSGTMDSGVDGGRDAGPPDAGEDAGQFPACATIQCPPWQRCVEQPAPARCEGTVTISWVSPSAGASAPIDLQSIPLAINTNADSTVDVPWSSSGVLQSAGAFSGQVGVRGATLFLADTDAGTVVLTAGWAGGPSASTQLMLTRPIVRPPPTPSFGTNGPDFEPNDPSGNAFRRDDVVPIEVDDLPQPIALFAKLDAPNAQTSSFPVTQRCNAGNCWLVQLRLGDLDFPAFRGRVLVWASGADGGMQTRPRSIPVTRWRWRRQVSGVPNPIGVTRPVVVPNEGIFIGSQDGPITGSLRLLDGRGQLLAFADPVLAQNTRAVTTIASVWSEVGFGLLGSTGFAYRAFYRQAEGTLDAGAPVASGGVYSTATTFGVAPDGMVTFLNAITTAVQVGASQPCTTSVPFEAIAASDFFTALFSAGGPICFTTPDLSVSVSTSRRYGKAFARRTDVVLAAGADGGIWSVTPDLNRMITEEELWDGGVVDAIAWTMFPNITTLPRVFWVNSDRSIQSATIEMSSLPFQFTPAPPTATVLSARTRTSPVLVVDNDRPDRGAMFVVDEQGNATSFELATLRARWTVPSGGLGIGGAGAVDPIFVNSCNGLGSYLIASRNGSLYALIGDRPAVQSSDIWPMGGRNQDNLHGHPSIPNMHCLTQ